MGALMTYEGFCIDGPIAGEYLESSCKTVFVPVYPRMGAGPLNAHSSELGRAEYSFHAEPSGFTYWSTEEKPDGS